MNRARDSAVLACRVFQPELASLGLSEAEVHYLDQGLHRRPEQLARELSATLAGLEEDPALRRVILVYGYCGGGLAGLAGRRVELLAPLAHDCIPLFLGDSQAPPGVGCGRTFYLTPGWIDYGQTPYSEYFRTRRRFGRQDALWVGRQMLAAYRRVALVETGAGLAPRHRRYARNMARLFDLSFQEIKGSRRWLRRLLAGRSGPGLALLPPGRAPELDIYPRAEPPAPGPA